MADKTGIEWTDKTWNPVRGCSMVSEGCRNCYAMRFAHRWPKLYGGLTDSTQRWTGDVRLVPEMLDAPLHWRKPRRIFVNSMSDLFHEAVPSQFIADCFGVMEKAKQHTFQILTKRPERLEEVMRLFCYGVPLPNVWLGVSVEDQATADERIPLLLETPAAVRFVSYEPALGPVDFETWLNYGRLGEKWDSINWLIAGGESGPHARPAHPDWFRSVRDQCLAAQVPFFFKQWGEWCGFEDAGKHYVGAVLKERTHSWPNGRVSYRVGKKAAGRLLDGREWNEYPER